MITREARRRMAAELFQRFKPKKAEHSIIVLVLDADGADVHTDLKPIEAAEAMARCALSMKERAEIASGQIDSAG